MGRFWLNKTSAETGKLRAGKAELIFFSDKINLKKVSESFISLRYMRNFGVKNIFFSIFPLYKLRPYKYTTEYISKKTSEQAGKALIS